MPKGSNKGKKEKKKKKQKQVFNLSQSQTDITHVKSACGSDTGRQCYTN